MGVWDNDCAKNFLLHLKYTVNKDKKLLMSKMYSHKKVKTLKVI